MAEKPQTLNSDTICAIATAPGTGGIAVIRLAGPEAFAIADKIWQGTTLSQTKSHTAHLGNILDTDNSVLDQAVATTFRAPHSYTGDDTVEFSVHGSPYVQKRLLEVLCHNGARIAQPGEYTRRAFTAGNIDLSQAEAIADLIAARSRAAHRVAVSQMRGGVSRRLNQLRQQLIDLSALLELELDFSEQDVEFAPRDRLIDLAQQIYAEVTRLHGTYSRGAAIREGIPVAIAGPTNAGKSSLLNTLLGDDRAIVSDIHGTTRDTIEDTITIGDHLVRIIDTAGLRHTNDTIEQIGIQRTRRAINTAAITLLIVDATAPDAISGTEKDTFRDIIANTGSTIIAAINKTDIADPHPAAEKLRQILPPGTPLLEISAHTGLGIPRLLRAIEEKLTQITGDINADILITNARQAQALADAATAAAAVIDALRDGIPADLVALDIRDTLHHLASLTGTITSTTILHTIFSRFCIGK